MFDSSAGFTGPLRREAGTETVKVRFPSDDEWVERSRAWHVNISRLGRGVSETSVENLKADLDLYRKIRDESSPDLVAEEAAKIIEVITRCEVINCTLGLDEAIVDMIVTGGQRVKHTLRLPTTAEVTTFKRTSARVMDLPHGRQQVRNNIHAGATLFEKCTRGHEGYANGVPIAHRDSAMRAVIDACELETEGGGEDF